MHRAKSTKTEISDSALIARLGTDRDALEVFYRRHIGKVTEFAARRSRTAGDVADVVSVTFMNAVAGAHTFDPRRSRGSALGWLIGIAFNELREQARREHRQATLVARERGRRLLDDDDISRIDRLIDAQRVTPSLDRALQELSANEREAILLVAVDGFTPREAAVALGVTSTVLRARLSRAKGRLRGLMTEGPDVPSPIGVSMRRG